MIQITLRSSAPALGTVFQPGATLIVLGAGGWKPTELEVTLVQHPVTVHHGATSGAGSRREHEIDHNRGRMPLPGRDSRI